MGANSLNRRQLLAACGAAISVTWDDAHALAVPGSAADKLQHGLSIALARANAHFYNSKARSIRPTNGSGRNNGLVDYTISNPALWQRESFANVIFNEWKRTGDDGLRRRMLEDWTAVKASYTPGQLIGMASGVPSFRIVTTFDDASWLCSYLMHAHIAGAEDALGYLVEAIAYNTTRFADPDRARNPSIIYVAESPNLPRIDYKTGLIPDAIGRRSGPPMTASRFGSLYTLPGASNYEGGYGKCSTSFEAHMGLAAFYVYDRLRYPWMLEYATAAQNFVKTCLLTPDPRAVPIDAAHTPAHPSARKARYLVEAEYCLSDAVPGNDPYPSAFRPRNQWYGKPVRNLDSTYLGGALAYCVLSARLYRLGCGDEFRRDALNTAGAIVSPQGYGRVVGGSTLIANTRDPHSEAHWAAPFVAEVLALPGAPTAIGRAFVQTGVRLAAHCLTPDGYVTADWAGPECNPVTGRWTWDEDYLAQPGAQAGHVQIMTTAESIAMLQACVLATYA